jgi:hypothetical protein
MPRRPRIRGPHSIQPYFGQPSMKTLFDYGEAAEFIDLSPAHVKRLCDLHKLGYVVKEYRRGYGRYRRLKC